MKNVD